MRIARLLSVRILYENREVIYGRFAIVNRQTWALFHYTRCALCCSFVLYCLCERITALLLLLLLLLSLLLIYAVKGSSFGVYIMEGVVLCYTHAQQIVEFHVCDTRVQELFRWQIWCLLYVYIFSQKTWTFSYSFPNKIQSKRRGLFSQVQYIIIYTVATGQKSHSKSVITYIYTHTITNSGSSNPRSTHELNTGMQRNRFPSQHCRILYIYNPRDIPSR